MKSSHFKFLKGYFSKASGLDTIPDFGCLETGKKKEIVLTVACKNKERMCWGIYSKSCSKNTVKGDLGNRHFRGFKTVTDVQFNLTCH